MIPGDNLQLTDNDLLQSIGRYLSLLEMEQRKRIVLAQAYTEIVRERDELKAELDSIKFPSVNKKRK